MSKVRKESSNINQMEKTMQPHEVIIPIVFFLTIAGIWGFTLKTRHTERMTMIEKGLKPEDMKGLYERGTMRINPMSSLKWGMIFFAIGLAVLIGMYLHATYLVEEGIYPALMCLLGGLGLIAFYLFANKKLKS
jgi:hypothetical protein